MISYKKYKIIVEYNGNYFYGWQYQPNRLSVQEIVSAAASLFSNIDVDVVGSSRTDVGVHATNQVCHAILREEIPYKVTMGLNFYLNKFFEQKQKTVLSIAKNIDRLTNNVYLEKELYSEYDYQQNRCKTNYSTKHNEIFLQKNLLSIQKNLSKKIQDNFQNASNLRRFLPMHIPIIIKSVEIVNEDFHARFDAKKRKYVYKICNRQYPIAIQDGFSWWVKRKLDVNLMTKACKFFEGTHDFSNFRSVNCDKNPVKTIDSCTVHQNDDESIEIHIAARSFLHNQVRLIVGTLKKIGEGSMSLDDISILLTIKKPVGDARCTIAPACGLYLTDVLYD